MATEHEAEHRTEVDLVGQARRNDAFRRVLITGEHTQVVVMTIPPGGEIGAETHPGHDQVLFFVDGTARAVLDGDASEVHAGDLVFVHAGVHHNFINIGEVPLRLATAYAPPEHAPGTVHRTKEDAEAAEGT